jgi:predicted DNA-binding transcriptional regulator AlpA
MRTTSSVSQNAAPSSNLAPDHGPSALGNGANGPPVLAYRLGGLARSLSVSRRWLEREINAGRFPEPDRKVGRVGLWKHETVTTWLAGR